MLTMNASIPLFHALSVSHSKLLFHNNVNTTLLFFIRIRAKLLELVVGAQSLQVVLHYQLFAFLAAK